MPPELGNTMADCLRPEAHAGANRWYALYTCVNQEKQVAMRLEQQGIEFYLPLYRTVRRRSDRRVALSLPLFPGYLTKPFDVDELRARVRSGRRILDLQHALLKTQDALQYEAAHDPLTGLWNRGAILDLLRRETQRHQRTGSALGVAMVDVDHFKQVNDTYGHQVGDVVLREVAKRLSDSVRTYDLVGRYGGEEFLVVMPSCDPPDLRVGAERLRNAICGRPMETTAGPLTSSISVGLASAPAGDATTSELEALLKISDDALYRAKANGRNRVEIGQQVHSARAGSE